MIILRLFDDGAQIAIRATDIREIQECPGSILDREPQTTIITYVGVDGTRQKKRVSEHFDEVIEKYQKAMEEPAETKPEGETNNVSE